MGREKFSIEGHEAFQSERDRLHMLEKDAQRVESEMNELRARIANRDRDRGEQVAAVIEAGGTATMSRTDVKTLRERLQGLRDEERLLEEAIDEQRSRLERARKQAARDVGENGLDDLRDAQKAAADALYAFGQACDRIGSLRRDFERETGCDSSLMAPGAFAWTGWLLMDEGTKTHRLLDKLAEATGHDPR